MSDVLLKLREQIDRLDAEILDRLALRAQCAQKVGEAKQHQQLYRPEREAQVLRRLAELNPGPLSDRSVQQIFREIMSACLHLEQPLRVAYLGPAGTFSESAGRKHFGHGPELSPVESIEAVFRAVEARNTDYGVVPIENSTEGAIGITLDLLLANSLKICGEVKLRIHQHLLSRAARLDQIKTVYSHPQSLAQCHGWLNQYLPGVPRIPVASNAEAARLAAQDESVCAVAGEAAAEKYELGMLAAAIEDRPDNTTRFVIIAVHDAGVSGHDKTSLVFTAPNQPGAIHSLLEPFARYGVDMTKLESRPARGGLWEYAFYVDIKGHQTDPAVAAALSELSTRAGSLKVLGSYPVAVI